MKVAIKATWASITPQQGHRPIASIPHCAEITQKYASICVKGATDLCIEYINEHTLQTLDISVLYLLIDLRKDPYYLRYWISDLQAL